MPSCTPYVCCREMFFFSIRMDEQFKKILTICNEISNAQLSKTHSLLLDSWFIISVSNVFGLRESHCAFGQSHFEMSGECEAVRDIGQEVEMGATQRLQTDQPVDCRVWHWRVEGYFLKQTIPVHLILTPLEESYEFSVDNFVLRDFPNLHLYTYIHTFLYAQPKVDIKGGFKRWENKCNKILAHLCRFRKDKF